MTPVIFINCNTEPFVNDIMCYLKQYETRNRNTLGRFIGERVLLAETGHGTPLVKCSAVIDEVISVTTEEAWDEYLELTWIPVGSEYDWKPDTKVKWLYHLTDVQPVVPFRLPSSCRRHGRVWAELNDFEEVTYWNSGGGILCYSALYKGKYWLFGDADYINAYSVDVSMKCGHGGLDNKFDGDPNPYRIEEATDFPTWQEVLDSIPNYDVLNYWGSREAMCNWYRRYQGGSLDKRVNED